MPKIDICALDHKLVQKFYHYIGHQCLPLHHKQNNQPCFKSQVFFLNNILPFSIRSTCFSQFCFVYVQMNHSRSRILIPLSRSVALSSIAHFLFVTTFQFTPLHLHCPLLCFLHCLHLCDLLYVHMYLCG
jgi:hypothetical protein